MDSKQYLNLTPYEKFIGFLDGLKMVLHPDVSDKLIMLATAYVDDERQKAKDLRISPELAELETDLLRYKKLCADAKQGHGPGGKMDLEFIIKKIKKQYGE